MELDFSIKRGSLLSDKIYTSNTRESIENKNVLCPKDKFYLATLVAFFTGMVGMLPITFFLTANDYWMFKFRDPHYETYDLNNKTHYQKMFVSFNSITTSVPNIISIVVTALYAHKIETRRRFLITLGSISVLFVIFTIFVKVNTDSWQTQFLVIVLLVIAAITCFSPFYIMTNIEFMSRFPYFYMKINLIGAAVGGLFGSSLQLFCLTLGNNSTQTALIYFGSGTALMICTFTLIVFMKSSPVITFYVYKQLNDKPGYTLREYGKISKTIWPLLIMYLLLSLNMGPGHPNITSLVVSEGYTGKGENLWYDKYFVAVGTYFLYDCFQVIGQVISKPLIKRSNYIWYLALYFVLSATIAPLFIFCNAQPRHLPVWFHHDYQYMLIQASASCINSILGSMVLLSIPNFAEEKTDIAYVFTLGFVILCNTVTNPLNPIYVNLL